MDREYKDFCKNLKKALEKRFMEEDYRIEFHSIEKNNAVRYDGIAIYSAECCISPNFSVEPLYENFKQGVSIDEIVDHLVMRYSSEQFQIKKMELDMDYEMCRKRIIFRLISYVRNEKMLRSIPHVRFLDMALVFYVLVYQSDEKVGSFKITKKLMELWKVDQKTLTDLAMENTKKMFPLKMHNMHRMVLNMLSAKEKNTELEDYFKSEFDGRETETPVVLTTDLGINGAAVLLYDDTLHRVSDLFQGDFYVLPSSIHEVLALPGSPEMSLKKEELKKIVSEVNRECVLQDEFLSEHVYFYDSEKDMLEICI